MSVDISSLLDSNLDDLADLPAFAVLQPGVHRVSMSWEQKEINQHPALELKMKLIETKELADTTQTAQEPGTEASVAYMLDNEFGQGNLKEILKPLGQALGLSAVNQIIEQSNGMEVTIVTKVRQDKSDSDKKYLQIKALVVE